jgi:stage V sporulation protein AD
MAEGLLISSLLIDSGAYSGVIALTGSHFCTAERQYRFPMEYGGQRTPSAQWTVTGAGAVLLSNEGGPRISHVSPGCIVDAGICDAGNMGAAMAPAAYDTITKHFNDTGRDFDYYDAVFTGDLGALGREIVYDLFAADGISLSNYSDCGLLLFDRDRQDVHCGASGCGCSAAVLNGHIIPGLLAGRWRRVLFCPTGALLSPTSTFQGESIPAICHAVVFSNEKGAAN